MRRKPLSSEKQKKGNFFKSQQSKGNWEILSRKYHQFGKNTAFYGAWNVIILFEALDIKDSFWINNLKKKRNLIPLSSWSSFTHPGRKHLSLKI